MRGSIKLVIINMTCTCMESYPLSYEMDGCFFLKHGLKSDCSEKILKNFSRLKK